MKKEKIMYAVVGLLIGVAVTYFATAKTATAPSNSNQTSTTVTHDMSSMNEMMNSLMGKSGDDFDKAFIVSMIEHHQGAIDMANEAKKNALHDEIKKMADEIITAQSKEIEMMRQWQKDWGY